MIEDRLKVRGSKLVEVRQDISFESGSKDLRYQIETYIFTPVSLQINSQTFKPQDCLHLFKNYLRLKAPKVPLEDLAGESDFIRSFDVGLEALRSTTAVNTEHQYRHHLRNFAATYARSVREAARGLSGEDAEGVFQALSLMKRALAAYRGREQALDELDARFGIPTSRFCDEYMSEVTLSEIQRLVSALAPGPAREEAVAFWNAENAYRIDRHPESEVQGEDAPAKKLYRFRLLTRYVESYLFLNIHSHSGPTLLVHSLYGLAAALSMVFATVVAFVWQEEYGALSYNLFIALVIAYIFKDRIKAVLQVELSERFKRWIPDRRLEILRDGVHKVGSCKESFSFFGVRHLPESIRNLRQKVQSAKGIYNWRFENILLYKKEMTVHTDPELFTDARYAILDTTWFNLSPLLDFIDANRDRLPVAPSAVEPPEWADKYYHVYLVRSLTVFDAKGRKSSSRDEVTRIAIDHEGIRSLETVKPD